MQTTIDPLSQPPSNTHLAEGAGLLLGTQRRALLTWGTAHAYPQLRLKPHLANVAGARCWRLVAEKATDTEIGLALAATELWIPGLVAG